MAAEIGSERVGSGIYLYFGRFVDKREGNQGTSEDDPWDDLKNTRIIIRIDWVSFANTGIEDYQALKSSFLAHS
jgi:hypothetical protein